MGDNETVADVAREFDAMAAECGGLEAATIHAMTLRINVAHAREIESLQRELDNERVRGVHTCSIYCDRPLCVARREIESLRQRVEAAEAAGRRVITAFEAHGKAKGVGDDLSTRAECERAMVALAAAISAERADTRSGRDG